MALPFRKSGGGFLNGVAGTIVGYNFEAKEWPGKNGKESYTTLSVELQVKQDGADAPVKQFLQAGFLYDNQDITDDGQELTSDDDRAIISEDSEAAKFLQSAIDGGLDEAPFVESGLRSLAGLVNQRFKFKRVVDEEATKKFGKRKGKDKDGKPAEYNRDNLLVDEYLGEAEAPVVKGRGKTAAPKATAKGGKVNGTAKNAEADAQVEKAESVLLDILASAGKALDRTGLSAKIVRYSTENPFSDDAEEHNAIRESLRKLIGSEDFLNRQNGWKFDAKSKGQPVSLG